MTEYDLIETVLSLQSEVQALKNSNGGGYRLTLYIQ